MRAFHILKGGFHVGTTYRSAMLDQAGRFNEGERVGPLSYCLWIWQPIGILSMDSSFTPRFRMRPISSKLCLGVRLAPGPMRPFRS